SVPIGPHQRLQLVLGQQTVIQAAQAHRREERLQLTAPDGRIGVEETRDSIRAVENEIRQHYVLKDVSYHVLHCPARLVGMPWAIRRAIFLPWIVLDPAPASTGVS